MNSLIILAALAGTPCPPADVCVSWGAVTTRVDGSPLTNVTYRVYAVVGDMLELMAPSTTTSAQLQGVFPEYRCFVVTALDSAGLESAPSNVACKRAPAPTEGSIVPTPGRN